MPGPRRLGVIEASQDAAPPWRIAAGPEGTGVAVDGTIEFLFDSFGAVVAFRDGRGLFDLDLCWLGWAPWNDGDVFDPTGGYLGTITPGGRLYEIEVRRGLTSPPPRTPTIGRQPDPPRGCAPERLAAGMRDVRPRLLMRPHQLGGPVAADGDADPASLPVRRGLSTGSRGRATEPGAQSGGSGGGLGVSADHEADRAMGPPSPEPQTNPDGRLAAEAECGAGGMVEAAERPARP